jgi:glycosyltransferase involved in cell wall biosynthesis
VKHSVSAFVLTQNNEATIRACLDSVTWCDEIVIIDSFSTDRTLEIAREYPRLKIYQNEYTTAAEQRIWGNPNVSSEWVFIIDSDEECPPDLRDKFISILEQDKIENDGFVIRIRTRFMGRLLEHHDYISAKGKRLVLKEVATRYKKTASVHATIKLDHIAFIEPKYYLIHNPIRSLDLHYQKMIRYARWQAQDMHVSGRKAHWWHILLRPIGKFMQFYLVYGGFRDGLQGLLICLLAAYSIFLKFSLLYDLQRQD